MTASEPFALMLTGGHPNSLGRTVEVVDSVLADQSRLDKLYECYFDEDEVVRLRTSNAFKRIWRARPEWVVPYVDRFITTISQIDQDSARWTISDLFRELDSYLTDEQRAEATDVLKHNLETCDDWIVLNTTMQTLGEWAQKDDDLRTWLIPHLERLLQDTRKSVSKRAGKLWEMLS